MTGPQPRLLEDVSEYSFEQRESRYRINAYGDEISYDSIEHGHRAATAEMLNEIHVMLYALCKEKGLVK